MHILDFSASLGKFSHKRGFTLIEMAVTLGLVAILSGIMIGYSRSAAKSLALSGKESEVLGMILYTKSLSQSFIISKPVGESICAYGLHVDRVNKKIFVFQDRVLDSEDCDGSDDIYTSGEELLGEKNNINIGAEFAFISSTDDLNDVIFIPPDPEVVINSDRDISSRSIAIGLADDLTSKFTLRISDFGQIDRE